jgi:hypothetical protein
MACDEAHAECVACESDAQCDDGLFCNGAEVCSGGRCYSRAAPCPGRLCNEDSDVCYECLVDADCQDGDSCTTDTCTDGVCAHTPIPDCQSDVFDSPGADSDGDGVPNGADACPETPAGEAADDDGCSCSQLDEDRDRVNDCDDRCPRTPLHTPVDANGCSCLQLDPVTDRDADGVVDCLDACLGTPIGERVDGNGCSCLQRDPNSDEDEDGVVDCLDRCPETERGVIVDDTGCPDPRYLDGNNGAEKPVLPDDPNHTPSRQPLTGQFSGNGGGCGALGLIHLTFLLTGLYCLRTGRNRPRA